LPLLLASFLAGRTDGIVCDEAYWQWPICKERVDEKELEPFGELVELEAGRAEETDGVGDSGARLDSVARD